MVNVDRLLNNWARQIADKHDCGKPIDLIYIQECRNEWRAFKCVNQKKCSSEWFQMFALWGRNPRVPKYKLFSTYFSAIEKKINFSGRKLKH